MFRAKNPPMGARLSYWLRDYPGEKVNVTVTDEHDNPIAIECDHHPNPVGDDLGALLFRATKELLINVVKHAKAGGATVSLYREGDNVRVTVEDDGTGFDTSTIAAQVDEATGFGLLSIRERLRHIGGRFEADSEPDGGARISRVAPLEPDTP